ncbi:hypothetical protein HDU98_001624 [Podochytrium sp. JEL0797]|nr:hypothetical protein HDU98_001624 [Podochytrium sp. JEL0797]
MSTNNPSPTIKCTKTKHFDTTYSSFTDVQWEAPGKVATTDSSSEPLKAFIESLNAGETSLCTPDSTRKTLSVRAAQESREQPLESDSASTSVELYHLMTSKSHASQKQQQHLVTEPSPHWSPVPLTPPLTTVSCDEHQENAEASLNPLPDSSIHALEVNHFQKPLNASLDYHSLGSEPAPSPEGQNEGEHARTGSVDVAFDRDCFEMTVGIAVFAAAMCLLVAGIVVVALTR